jgi:hypothetical protein
MPTRTTTHAITVRFVVCFMDRLLGSAEVSRVEVRAEAIALEPTSAKRTAHSVAAPPFLPPCSRGARPPA